jgi:ABC-type polar amino acid transport system ATPase subunit
VLDNVMLAPLYHKLLDRAAAREQALWLLDRVGLLAHAENTRISSPAASSSAWPSPAPWR